MPHITIDHVALLFIGLVIAYCLAKIIFRAYFEAKAEYVNKLMVKLEELRTKWQRTGN